MKVGIKEAILAIIFFFVVPFIVYGIVRTIKYSSPPSTTLRFENLKDPEVFQKTFFPGCPECNDITEYFDWRDKHPNYKSAE